MPEREAGACGVRVTRLHLRYIRPRESVFGLQGFCRQADGDAANAFRVECPAGDIERLGERSFSYRPVDPADWSFAGCDGGWYRGRSRRPLPDDLMDKHPPACRHGKHQGESRDTTPGHATEKAAGRTGRRASMLPVGSEGTKRYHPFKAVRLLFGGHFLHPCDHHVRVMRVPEADAQIDLFGLPVADIPPDRGTVRESGKRRPQQNLGDTPGAPNQRPVFGGDAAAGRP